MDTTHSFKRIKKAIRIVCAMSNNTAAVTEDNGADAFYRNLQNEGTMHGRCVLDAWKVVKTEGEMGTFARTSLKGISFLGIKGSIIFFCELQYYYKAAGTCFCECS